MIKPQPRSGLGGWALNRLRWITDYHLDLLIQVLYGEITNQLNLLWQGSRWRHQRPVGAAVLPDT